MSDESLLKQYKKELGTTNSRIISALKLAQEKHKDLYRKSGEPYIEHCIAVYKILKSWGIRDNNLLIAALLHDTVEDTDLKIEQISDLFGKEVAFLVDSVTKIQLGEKEGQDFKTLKKVVDTSYIDPKVSVLKLADRYHNLSTLQYLPNSNRKKNAKESLEVYAKLAESLGIWVIKTEMEDLSFQYLQFDIFSKVKNTIDQDKRLSKTEMKSNLDIIKTALTKVKVSANIQTKIDGYYNIYQKLQSNAVKGLASSEDYRKINDVISYRIIVKTIKQCYEVLYAIHSAYGEKVDFNRFDEFIGANKRLNGYEALQTTIETEYGSIEIAIATENMENFNNWGYIFNLKKGIKNSSYNLKLIFTPAKDLVFLPEKAIAIDFAYAVNQKLGDNSIKVKANGNEEELTYLLKNADTIEVITGKRSVEEDRKLSRVCLKQTQKYLERRIIKYEKNNSIEMGRRIFENRLSPRGILDLEDIGPEVRDICYSLGCENVGEVYYKISKGYLDIEKLDDLLNEYGITKSKRKRTTVETTGVDKPGLLKSITDAVNKNGGNIIRIVFNKDENNNNFYFRILIEDVNMGKLKQDLAKNNNLKNLKIV